MIMDSKRMLIMFKSTVIYFVYFMLITTIGCGDQSEKNQSEKTSAVIDMPELAAYTGPAIAFRVTPEESATQFNWSVRVLSGGWEI